MTQTTITDHPQAHPTNALLTLIVTLLAPTFLGVTAGDLTLARMAAIQTINDYRARNHADLIAIAQIIACGLAALGSLSQSMDDDISLSMTLRLRGNAVALNRSAEQNRRVLQQPIRDTPTPLPAWHTPEPLPANPAPPTGNSDWASAMTRMATKLSKNAPPAATVQHTVNAMWIDTLNTVARDITPNKTKAELLRTTALATNPPPERT